MVFRGNNLIFFKDVCLVYCFVHSGNISPYLFYGPDTFPFPGEIKPKKNMFALQEFEIWQECSVGHAGNICQVLVRVFQHHRGAVT